MGGTQSVEKAQADISKLHTEIDNLTGKIQREGDKAVDEITSKGYDSRETLCQQLAYHYVDRLKNQFPVQTLQGVGKRLQLGLVPQGNDLRDGTTGKTLVEYKDQICTGIVNLFLKKIDAIQKIQGAIPACAAEEREIYDVLSGKLRDEPNINTDKWANAYTRVSKFNKSIKSSYAKLNGMIDKIRKANTRPKVDSLHKETIRLINDTNKMCEGYKSDLFELRKDIASKTAVPTAAAATKPPVPVSQNDDSYPATVLYDFDAEQEGDLNIKRGDMITILGLGENEGWLLARKNGNEGVVPANYIQRN
jgi:hypothetical protein